MLQRGRFSAAACLLRAGSCRSRRTIFPGFQPRVGLRKSSSISSGECDSGSFYRSQIDADGRNFSFATVVVNSSSEKGSSALPAWSQACSLIGTSSPTLGLAFVSKYTPSSAAALEEIGKYFSDIVAGDAMPADPRYIAPFIGCIADVWNIGTPATTSAGGGGGEKRAKAQGASSAGMDDIMIDATESRCGKERPGGRFVARTSSEFSDDDTADTPVWAYKYPADDEALVSLDNALNSKPLFDSRKTEELEAALDSKRSEELRMEKDEGMSVTAPVAAVNNMDGVAEIVLRIKKQPAAEAVTASGSGDSSHATRSGGGTSSQISSFGNESFGTSDDDAYRMILCVAHLPGTKATAFHTTTTGLPDLPDMEDAVVRNNPHMILLGAPSYHYQEFVKRLSVMFPDSCRAGAFLAPLFGGLKVYRVNLPDNTKPLFVGARNLQSGVVGLSLSPDGAQGPVPVDVYSELLRMSLGMARISGRNFFDDAISNRLFFPKNALGERRASPRSAPVDPSSLLKRLNTFLLRRSKVQTQASVGGATLESSSQDNGMKVTDGNSCTTTSVEVKSSYAPGSTPVTPSPDESQSSDSSLTMPLALLDTVLFPGWAMPLHMHEPRYRNLVRHCVEEGKPFGLTSYWHWQNSEELVGTMANLKVYLFEKDCRSYVVAHGVRRFRVLSDKMWVKPGSFGLNMGQVEFFDDRECEKEELSDLAKRVVDRCRQLLPEAETVPGLVGSIYDPTTASFAVGQLLPVPVRVKRRWLGMADTKYRLLEQMTFLNS